MNSEEAFIVKVGTKKIWAYVTAAVTHINRGGTKVIVRARGKNIYKAVEVVNAIKRSFYTGIEIEKVSLSSDVIQTQNGEKRVSAIEITISLKQS